MFVVLTSTAKGWMLHRIEFASLPETIDDLHDRRRVALGIGLEYNRANESQLKLCMPDLNHILRLFLSLASVSVANCLSGKFRTVS